MNVSRKITAKKPGKKCAARSEFLSLLVFVVILVAPSSLVTSPPSYRFLPRKTIFLICDDFSRLKNRRFDGAFTTKSTSSGTHTENENVSELLLFMLAKDIRKYIICISRFRRMMTDDVLNEHKHNL